jgi:excisionase family DNA binding protein
MPFDASASKDYLTLAELASQWRCTQQHISSLIKRGSLSGVRIGRRVIVRQESVRSFEERHATAQAAAA